MNLLADEGVERQIVERLRQDGYAVVYIAELEPGIDDDVILGRANAAQALLITADKDFGELIFRQRLVHAGVILVRLAGLLPDTKARVVADWPGCEKRKPRYVRTRAATNARENSYAAVCHDPSRRGGDE